MSEQPNADGNGRVRRFRTPKLIQNWVGLSGWVLAVSAVFAFVLLFAIDLFGNHANPYMGILAYVVAPAFFFMGLGLVAIGYLLQLRHRKKTRGESIPLVFSIDLSRKGHRRMLGAFIVGSTVFLLLTAFGSYQTYHVTESVAFCGEVCHVPMEPQFVTYQHSHHAKVDCVDCHIAPGTAAYLKTKLNGVAQLWHVTLGDFARPIVLHDRERRPTQETCENCHWRERHSGMIEKTFRSYLADEENTPWTVRMLLHVGGGDPVQGPVSGIHWHRNLANRVDFISPDGGTTIPWVRLTDADGKITEFTTEEFKENPDDYPLQTLDCMDCHNRPAHQLSSPNEAVDLAMSTGRIDPAMPWVKMKAVEALTKPYDDSRSAMEKIAEYLGAEYPGDQRSDRLIKEVQTIYQQNFFPEMKSDWRSYPDHSGHKNWAGCFRCHDGEHQAKDTGATIKASDCTTCHTILAQGNTPADLDTMNSKGLPFLHIDFEYEDFDCADCHTGANQEEE